LNDSIQLVLVIREGPCGCCGNSLLGTTALEYSCYEFCNRRPSSEFELYNWIFHLKTHITVVC